MRNTCKIFILLALPLFLSGCFWDSSIQSAAQSELVEFTGNIVPPEDAERILEEEFITAPVLWDEGRSTRIGKARDSIVSMGEYLNDMINFDSSIPYYAYKFWFEFTANQYMKLQVELDARIKVEGAISEVGIIVYKYVRRDINTMLDVQRMKISATEKSIEDKASADTIEDMKKIYSTIRPLIDMVL